MTNYRDNFKQSEFSCKGKCNYCPHKDSSLDMSQEFIDRLQKARDISKSLEPPHGAPFRVFSGIRCTIHNANINGATRSTHTPQNFKDSKGHAVDLTVRTKRERMIVVKSLILAGFIRLGINRTTIHVDDANFVEPVKGVPIYVENLIWTYYK